jgi:hypothetical protein
MAIEELIGRMLIVVLVIASMMFFPFIWIGLIIFMVGGYGILKVLALLQNHYRKEK